MRAQLDDAPGDRQHLLRFISRRSIAAVRRNVRIPQIRSKRAARDSRSRTAFAEVIRLREGEREVTVLVGSYFWGGIEPEEQLDAALAVCEKSARS